MKISIRIWCFFLLLGSYSYCHTQTLTDRDLVDSLAEVRKRVVNLSNGDLSVVRVDPWGYNEIIAKKDSLITRLEAENRWLRGRIAELEGVNRELSDSLSIVKEQNRVVVEENIALKKELEKERSLRLEAEKRVLEYRDELSAIREVLDSLYEKGVTDSQQINQLEEKVTALIGLIDSFVRAFDQTIIHYKRRRFGIFGERRVSLFDNTIRHSIPDIMRDGEIVIEQSILRERSIGSPIKISVQIIDSESYESQGEFDFNLFESVQKGNNNVNIYVYSGEYSFYIRNKKNNLPYVRLEEERNYEIRIRLNDELLFKQGFTFEG